MRIAPVSPGHDSVCSRSWPDQVPTLRQKVSRRDAAAGLEKQPANAVLETAIARTATAVPAARVTRLRSGRTGSAGGAFDEIAHQRNLVGVVAQRRGPFDGQFSR